MAIVECDQSFNNLPTEEPGAPLKPATVRKWLSFEWETTKQEIAATIPLISGLTGRETRHLSTSWVVEKDDMIFVHIPHRARCVVRTDGPCYQCRQYGDGHFSPEHHSRQIPIYDERLADVLRVFDPPDGHVTVDHTIRGIHLLADNSAIPRRIGCRALRHTFGVALGAKNYNREEIQRWMGNDPTIKYSKMITARDYQNLGSTEPWDKLAALGTGEFRQ